MTIISNFLYAAICILFLPGVTESLVGSNRSEEDEEETSNSISAAAAATVIVSELPSSVVHEILLRLPHKSFIRCKCVCKSWYNLISDPYFTRAYFTNPQFTTIILSQHPIVNNRLKDVSFCFLEIESNGDVTRAPFHPNALNLPGNGTNLHLRGSCNGLLCITQNPLPDYESKDYRRGMDLHNPSVYVINPLLGEVLMLPPIEDSESREHVLYGFGCSRYSNRYKVLRVVMNWDIKTVHGEILTVGVDENWRYFEDASFVMELHHHGVALNGSVHFLGGDQGDGFILAFDVEEERGRYIEIPPELFDDPQSYELAVWDDKLCLADNSSETQVELWTMKEYGVVESWSREIILASWVPVELSPYPLNPITTLRNKDLLMSCDSLGDTEVLHLTSFNPSVKVCTRHEVAGETEDIRFEWTAYVPNVIPLMENLLGGGDQ